MHFPILIEEAFKSICILAIIETGAFRSTIYKAKREISAKSSLVLLADYSGATRISGCTQLSSIRMKYLYVIGGIDTIGWFWMAMTLPLSP
jgi:hypothetical protein